MDEFDLLKKKKTDGKKEDLKKDDESGLFEEMDVDLNSDLPVHEEFVDSKKVRKIARGSKQ
jgi:hypothetical protein